ncbi:MAG TPA: thiol:disulfide interchange protein DsbA/DsbL [Burkholderiales bacterium]|nr:thiol:disulfide interchange protein DsbA/DsbL [Burkholderiales bacterium]
MKTLAAFLAALLAFAPLAAPAQGRYTEIPQQQTDAGDKVDVIEFFSYQCIHCYNLEPVLEPWIKTLPPEARFRRVPAIFSARMEHDARIFYALEALGLLDKLHRPLFDAIHAHRLRTDSQEALTQWLEKQRVDPKKFIEAMKSFSVHSKTQRAKLMTVGYRIQGTPAMAVDGRYTVAPEQGGSREGMLQVVSQLVEQARKKQ